MAAESPFRFGNGEHAARGIKAREARARGQQLEREQDAAGDRRLQGTGDRVSAVQTTDPSARLKGPTALATSGMGTAGSARSSSITHDGVHPLFLASRRASDGFASAGEFIWVIDEPRLGLGDQCIGLRGEHRLRHSLYMGTFDVGDCKSMVLQFLLDRFSSKKFCQCYHFAGVKAFGSQ